ncbi:hypothetical protein NQ317_016733 [Molorchus minor]|uniref:Laminin N-terminal domain-containing protein n=1 Tax=Molorchus minor TaxID=1323400 RepID=A0ABQ9J949_9CUCU|nr:hypothetical protein NQ317_016733 [Molorchus minor]
MLNSPAILFLKRLRKVRPTFDDVLYGKYYFFLQRILFTTLTPFSPFLTLKTVLKDAFNFTFYAPMFYTSLIDICDKAFDITYVRLLFQSPRPESFYISKKITKDGPWIPFQFYSEIFLYPETRSPNLNPKLENYLSIVPLVTSILENTAYPLFATCRDTYSLPDSTHTTRGDETRALCTSEYSDISPLKGGVVAFGTLEGRPSAYNFDTSPELQRLLLKVTMCFYILLSLLGFSK